MKVLSIDTGFGDVKFAYRNGNSKPEYSKQINMIAKLGSGAEKKSTDSGIIEFKGEHYLFGQAAKQATNSQMIQIDTFESLQSITPLILKYALDKYGDVDQLIISISIAFKEKSGEYLAFAAQNSGFPAEKMAVLPQGVGCKLAMDNMGLNLDDTTVKESLKNYIAFDIGFNTIDMIKTINGVLIPQNIIGLPGQGITKVLDLVKSKLSTLGINDDVPLTKLKECMSTKNYTSRGVSYDLTKIIDESVQKYIGDLHTFLESKFSEELNSIHTMVLFGGGANLIREYLSIWSAFYPTEFVRIPLVGAEFYNALGGLFYTIKK